MEIKNPSKTAIVYFEAFWIVLISFSLGNKTTPRRCKQFKTKKLCDAEKLM